jgi:uncharacterized membrane protein YraQ (UPF0718 family)
MLGRVVNACIIPLMFVCAALIFIAAYLGMGGHEIVAFWIALPATALITIGITHRFLRN